MPIVLELDNHNKAHAEALKRIKTIYINDLPNSTEEDKERIKSLTLNQLNSDTVSIIPRCGCGRTKGRFALGKQCMICQDVVKSNIDESITSLLWFRKPEFVSNLMNPVAWGMLDTYFSKSGWSAIQYLTDSLYVGGSRIPPEIEKLSEFRLERDFNFFTENFETCVEALMAVFKPKPNKPYNELIDWLDNGRDCIFSDFQPVLNRALFVTDKTNLGIYMENSVKDAVDAYYHVVSIDKDFHDRSEKVIVNRTARMQARMATFFDKYTGSNMQPKPAHYRRHIYGSRVLFAARGVISSVTDHHNHDEVGVPWCIAVPMYQHHLMGKLMRHGFTYNGALGYVYRHVHIYDELIHRFLDEIFREYPGGRGPVMLLHRNPTLQQGSMQRVFGYLKTDTRDKTISMSILIVVAPNADFDGDALNLMLAPDAKMARYWEVFAPDYNIFLMENPMETSGNLALTKPIVMSGGAWLADEDLD